MFTIWSFVNLRLFFNAAILGFVGCIVSSVPVSGWPDLVYWLSHIHIAESALQMHRLLACRRRCSTLCPATQHTAHNRSVLSVALPPSCDTQFLRINAIFSPSTPMGSFHCGMSCTAKTSRCMSPERCAHKPNLWCEQLGSLFRIGYPWLHEMIRGTRHASTIGLHEEEKYCVWLLKEPGLILRMFLLPEEETCRVWLFKDQGFIRFCQDVNAPGWSWPWTISYRQCLNFYISIFRRNILLAWLKWRVALRAGGERLIASVAVLAEISLGSPRKRFIFRMRQYIYRIKVYKK